MKSQSIIASVLTIACSFCVLTSSAATVNVSTLRSGETITIDGVLNMDDNFDLGTNTLTLKGVSGITGSGFFTGSVGSVLDIEITADLTMVDLQGALKLVKRGGNKLSLYKDANVKTAFSGGAEVYAGVLTTAKYGAAYLPFGNPPDIVVHKGASLLPNACYGFLETHKITLNGGTLGAGRKDANESHVFKPALILTADSVCAPGNEMTLGTSIDLGMNYTLTVAPTAMLTWKPASIENGTIYLNSGNFTLGADVGMPTEGTPTANLELGPKAVITSNGHIYSVKDLVLAAGLSVAAPIYVYGTYKPASANAYMPTMKDGSTLDLSAFSEPFSLDSTKLAGAVTIALGGRTLEKNQQIITWSNGVAPTFNPVFTVTDASFDTSKFLVTATGVVFDANTETAASAIWKGTDGNFNNVENWTFKTATDVGISVDADAFNEIKSTLAVTIEGDISGLTFDDTFPFASLTLKDATLSADMTWGSTFEITKITESSNIDLQGHALTLTVGSDPFKVPITSNAADGSVTIIVPDGVEFDNAGLDLTGSIKLIKDGEGTMIASLYPADFEYGTEILAGTLKCNILNMNTENGKSLFGANNTVTVKGGVLDPAGGYLWGNQTVVMDGGMISNTVANTGLGSSTTAASISDGIQFNPVLVLKRDAVLATAQSFNFRGTIQTENNAKLILKPASGTNLLWLPANADNAYVQVAGEGTFLVWGKGPVADENQDGLTFEVTESAKINMNTYSTSTKDYLGGMRVQDYIADSIGVNIGAGELRVSGTFTPKSEHFYGATMLGGSYINLADKNEAFSIDSKDTGVTHALKFAGGKVTLKLGSRALNPGDQILAWTARPVGVEFAFEGDKVDSGVQMVLGDEGLYYGYAEEQQIVWTNATGNNDLTNAENWNPKEVPTETKATFTGDVSDIKVPNGKSFNATKIWFNNAELSENADFSWLNLANVANESILDIKGHTLTLKGCEGECTSAGMITSSEENGLVKFEVPAGSTYTNANFIFDGRLSFEKYGKGVLVTAKYPQSYEGKTTIVEGGVRCLSDSNMNAENKASPFGAACTIVLGEGTFLDPAGSYAWANHTIEMNGGIISNTVPQKGAKNTQFNVIEFPKPFNPTLDLSVDSLFVSPVEFNFKGSIKPNGHKLTIKTPAEFRWVPTAVNAAEVEFTGKGHLVTLKNFEPNMKDITLVMNEFTFDVGCVMAVSNYTAMAGNTDPVSNQNCWHNVGGMTVGGTFTPTANKFFGCQMLDGSTIDLSGKKSTWSTTTDSSYENGPLTVTFADNATVTIDVHGRTFGGKNKQIVSWTTKPENVTFIIDAASKADGYELDVRDDGIYAKHLGIIMMLK